MKSKSIPINSRKSHPETPLARKSEKRFNRVALLTSLTFLLGSPSVMAQDRWVTVDELKPPVPTEDPLITGPGISGAALDVGVFGDRIFSVGFARHDSTGAYSAIIRKGTNNEPTPEVTAPMTWREVDYYQPVEWSYRKYRAFGAGADGTLYAAGDLFRLLPSGQWRSAWMVQKSTNGGENWEHEEIYEENGREWDKTACFDVKGHPNGDVYAVGSSVTTDFSWHVRKKSVGAASLFEKVDEVGPRFATTLAHAVAFKGGDILVVGRVDGFWTVRRSTNHGASWATVDTFQDGKGTVSEAMGITVHPVTGAIYVCGWAQQGVKGRIVYNWAVRRSVNGGNTWTTVDRFGAQAGPYDYDNLVMARGVTVTPAGTVFVCGVTPPPRKLMVRKGTTSASTGVMTWVISDQLVDPDGLWSAGCAIAADAAGNVYSSGLSKRAVDGTYFFLTRRLQGQP